MQRQWIPVTYLESLFGIEVRYMGSVMDEGVIAFAQETPLKVGGVLRVPGEVDMQITDLTEVTDLRKLRKLKVAICEGV